MEISRWVMRGRPRTRWINQIRKDVETREENGNKYKKTGRGE
jgi:hypothetical protein